MEKTFYVITLNNQNYDSGGEIPLSYKLTDIEASEYCENSNKKLDKWEK